MTALHLGLALLLLALVLLIISARLRSRTGLPGGRVIYSDTRAWGRVEKPLFDARLGLTGKPDYLVNQGSALIPVEVKSGGTPESPYDSHIFQLAAYCHLVHQVYGKRPPYGIIHYPQRDVAVDYTPALETALHHLVADIRQADHKPLVNRSHEEVNKCRGCGYHSRCDESLCR